MKKAMTDFGLDSNPASFRDVITSQGDIQSSSAVIRWLDETGAITKTLTYKDLLRLGFNVARYMKNQGVETGDRVAILFPASTPDFLVALFACQLLYVTAVPLPCPTGASEISSLLLLVERAKPAITLLGPDVKTLLQMETGLQDILRAMQKANRLGYRVVDVSDDTLGGTPFADERWESSGEEVPCVICFTSGNSGPPKGVVLSQSSFLEQIIASRCIGLTVEGGRGIRSRNECRVLIVQSDDFDWTFTAGVLAAFMSGADCTIQSTFAIRDPVKWMQVVSEQRIETIILSKSGSDALRVRRTPQESGPPSPAYKLLDLSSCSEVVCLGGPSNLSDVKEAIAKSALGGLSASKFKTIYGAAECGIIAVDEVGLGGSPAQGRSSCVGKPLRGVVTRIVDPKTLKELSENSQGEIWVSGIAQSHEYWGKTPTASDFSLKAKIDGKKAEEVYFRTGDLGFRVGETLFLSGRTSQTIKSDGKHRCFSTDIEVLLAAYDGVPRAVAISGSDEDNSTIVLVLELAQHRIAHMGEADNRAFCLAVQRRVMAIFGLQPARILLLPPNSIPCQSSGEPRRAGLIQMLDSGIVDAIYDTNPSIRAQAQPSDIAIPTSKHELPLHESVRKQWKAILEAPVDSTDDFYIDMAGTADHALKLTYAVQIALSSPSVAIHHLAANPTLEAYSARVSKLGSAGVVDTASSSSTKKWLWDQVAFPESFDAFLARKQVPAAPGPSDSSNAFFTGIGNPLGCFILAELLSSGWTSVYCLVHADSLEKGHQHIVNVLVRLGLWKYHWAGRIIPVLGSGVSERFGLSPQAFCKLADDIALIVHADESGNLLRSYAVEEGRNVTQTKEVIRLALSSRSGRGIAVHFISSIAIFDLAQYRNVSYAQELEVNHPPIDSCVPGYAQTKWVAEQLVLKASRDYGLPAAIYRVGPLLGASTTGAGFQVEGSLNGCLVNLAIMGAAPQLATAMNHSFTSVDFAAKVIAATASQHCESGQVAFYHVVDASDYPGHRILDVFEAVTGRPITVLDTDEWEALLRRSLPATVAPPQDDACETSVTVEFAGLASAFVPHTEADRARMGNFLGRSYSTAQLQDRLRRLSRTTPAYAALAEELAGTDVERTDRLLAVSIKWAMREAKRMRRSHIVATENTSVAATTTTTALPSTAVVSGDRRQDAQRDVKRWMLGTSSATLLSAILWVLLGGA